MRYGTQASSPTLQAGIVGPLVYPDPLRRVSYFDAETNKRLKFLTNNFTLPALTIAQIYKSRWQVELFFKWIKQHLRIKSFYGTSENAVKTQIWIAVSIYVLIAIVQMKNLTIILTSLLLALGLPSAAFANDPVELSVTAEDADGDKIDIAAKGDDLNDLDKEGKVKIDCEAPEFVVEQAICSSSLAGSLLTILGDLDGSCTGNADQISVLIDLTGGVGPAIVVGTSPATCVVSALSGAKTLGISLKWD